MPPANLDHWLSDATLRTCHLRKSPTTVHELWAAAETVRVEDCRVLGRLIRARIPGVPGGLTFEELFRSDPFYLLDDGPTHRLSGLCGRIWTIRRDYARLSNPEEFLAWQEPSTVRVLFASWAAPNEHGAELVSEVRVAAVDRRAALYVRALGPFITAFQGLVGTEPLDLAVQRAARSDEA